MSTVKNRIKRGTIPRLIISIIIFSALIIGLRAEKIPQNCSDKVKILILSKHVRLLKEGKTEHIQMLLPGTGELAADGERVSCRTLTVLYENNSFRITADNNSFTAEYLILYPKENIDTFSIVLNGEKRIYPLPLFIKNTRSEIELSIEENVNQFAIDSAWGELGDISDKNSEALFSLAHIIKARCSLPYLTNKHKGYHFCDLTCCQTYKGQSGKTFNDSISIKTEDIKNGLFFHSSSGGVLFTESIFNGRGRTAPPPKDIIYSENFTLSRNRHLSWNAEVDEHELAGILCPGKNIFLKNIIFDRDKEIVYLETGTGREILSPETFRLTINRVKGWNFLKSNNYTFTRTGGVYKFCGSGLGHGAGMSFDGALQLAEKGYSRYEILEHYYPGMEYNTSSVGVNHQLQYIIFDNDSGSIVQSSGGASFKNRIIPCGSIFKLFIALYIAENRTDLFHNYSYTCTDKEKDKHMPEQCWDKSGHGKMNINSALCHSCNIYFGSLYSRIDSVDFLKWITDFTLKQGIELTIPDLKNRNDFSNLLAGLNFNVTITIDGIMKLNRYIYMENKTHPTEELEIIFSALHKTFTEGTAKEIEGENTLHNISSPYNISRKNLWGKTGTVIAGTNSHCGYGIFTGGLNSRGIVAILRKGTGAITARESEKLLLNLK